MTPPRKAPSKRTKKGRAEKVQAMNRHISAVNDLTSRMRLGQRLAGIQYGGNRDIYAAAGYVRQGEEQFANYWALYKRGDIAGRIVDMPAKTTWRTPP